MIPPGSFIDVVLIMVLGLAMAPFIGRHIANVYRGSPSWADPILLPFERAVYSLLGVDPRKGMNWKQYARALILTDAIGIIAVFLLLQWQGWLPYNGFGAGGMSGDLAFHTASAFGTNTDYQHYVGESQVSLLTSLVGLQTLMFLSPATGLCVFAVLARAFGRRDGQVGNYYADVVRTITRILLPLAFLGAILFVLMGVPQTLAQATSITPIVAGGPRVIPLGPLSTWNSIELLGTNGGGYFAANFAHPFQNPSVATNSLAVLLMMAIPFATPFAFGRLVRRPGEAYPLVATVLAIFLVGFIVFLAVESSNPFLPSGVGQQGGYLVGAESRFTLPESALFQYTSVYTNTGATSMALGALTPLAQTVLLFGMFLQAAPGGDGTGFGMLLIYVVVAVFMGGLMVGRSPEYLGKKIGMAEVKWAAAALLSHPIGILIPLAVSLQLGVGQTAIGGYSPHGFTLLLYEFTSESANNGSGMTPIADNTLFFNVVGGLVMLLGRYFPILAMLAIAGSLAGKRPMPPGPGTLKTETVTFTVFLIIFLIIVAGLLFLPVLALGPFSQIVHGGL